MIVLSYLFDKFWRNIINFDHDNFHYIPKTFSESLANADKNISEGFSRLITEDMLVKVSKQLLKKNLQLHDLILNNRI